jgi:hypothetical protein
MGVSSEEMWLAGFCLSGAELFVSTIVMLTDFTVKIHRRNKNKESRTSTKTVLLIF